MRRYAIIKDGVVGNVIEYDAAPPTPPPGFLAGHEAIQSDEAGPGWLYEDGTFLNPAQDNQPPVPHSISDRQFFQMLAQLGIITTEEALAAVGPGTIPGPMEAMIQALPSTEQFASRMLLTGATSFERSHPLVAVFGTAFGWTPEQIDSFWVDASQL